MDGRRRRKMEEREEYGGAAHFKQTMRKAVTRGHVGLGKAAVFEWITCRDHVRS